MSIFYTLIARLDTHFHAANAYEDNVHILVELSHDCMGNFPQIAREYIIKDLPVGSKSVFNYKNKYNFHVLNERGFLYICLADYDFPRQKAQSFLKEIKEAFCTKYTLSQREKALTFGLNESFSGVVLEKMNRFNDRSFEVEDLKSSSSLTEKDLEPAMKAGSIKELTIKKVRTLDARSLTSTKDAERKAQLKKGMFFASGMMVVFYIALM